MVEIDDNLFHCSAHWNTWKTCLDNSVDGILKFIVDQASERNSHPQSLFTLGHHLPMVGAESEAW